MKVYVGIDGGGTKSRIAVMDAGGNILVRKDGDCTNQYSIGFEAAVRHIRELMEESVNFSSIAGFCLASAGLGRRAEASRFSHALGFSFPTYFCSDVEALLVGGSQSEEGICLICGTGSVAMGRDAKGRRCRSGGFGWRLGDEGSAWWQGQQAIGRSMRSEEGRDLPTEMSAPIRCRLGVERSEDLITLCNSDTVDKATIAALSPLVTEYARSGDPLAISIVNDSVQELTGLVDSIVKRLPSIEGRNVVCAGGVLEHDEHFVSLLQKAWKGTYQIIEPKGTALDGALILAKHSSEQIS
ncbi:MAG: BadF/BadG/BcrA/BcrD ATPase family protein [Sphaerochaeta sp.]|nr:BadF/BadG/BcrA/BcrD ATPase family protein [Sphaerochaeta sp.]